MDSTIAITIPVAAMAMVFGIVYIAVTASHRQKMAMIERGINPNIEKKNSLKDALMFLFVPIGLLIGYFFQLNFDMKSPFPYLIFGFLFAGIGQLVGMYIQSKKKNNNDSNSSLPIEL